MAHERRSLAMMPQLLHLNSGTSGSLNGSMWESIVRPNPAISLGLPSSPTLSTNASYHAFAALRVMNRSWSMLSVPSTA